MANSKVQLADGSVLIDLTSDTVTAAALRSGYTAHDAAGNPVDGALEVDPVYSVTKTLTNVTSSNNDTKVIAGGSFYADLTPISGYAITNVTVTMGGVDVTEQVFKPGVGGKGITANGVYSASDDALSGYDRVVVNVEPNLGTKSITENGTYTAPSDSLDGYSSVTVNVPTGGDAPELQSKTATYTPSTSTQTETIIADTGYDGLSSVGVTVNPIPSEYVIPNGTTTITENGTYDIAALASIIVSVASSSGSGLKYEVGTFTVANDTNARQTIQHTLGVKPDVVVVWTDYFNGGQNLPATKASCFGFFWLNGITDLKQRASSSVSLSRSFFANFVVGNGASVLSGSLPTSDSYQPAIPTDSVFYAHKIGSSTYWRAGATYHYFISEKWW